MIDNSNPTPEQLEAARAVSRAYGQRSAATARQRYVADVDRATPGLPEEQRQARAYELYKAHMAELARTRWANRGERAG